MFSKGVGRSLHHSTCLLDLVTALSLVYWGEMMPIDFHDKRNRHSYATREAGLYRSDRGECIQWTLLHIQWVSKT